jgi:hypothetical protein
MRIRTIDGPPLPAEIAAVAARAMALREFVASFNHNAGDVAAARPKRPTVRPGALQRIHPA